MRRATCHGRILVEDSAALPVSGLSSCQPLMPLKYSLTRRQHRCQCRTAGMVLQHLNREAVYSGPPDAKKLNAAGKKPIRQRAIIENGTEDWRTEGCVSMRAYTRAHTDTHIGYCIYNFSTSRHRKTTGRISCSCMRLPLLIMGLMKILKLSRRSIDEC